MKESSRGEGAGKVCRNGRGNSLWRDGTMTTPRLFDRMTADLGTRSRGPAGAAALARFASAGVDPGGALDPCHLARRLQAAGGGRWSEEVLARLADMASGDELAALVVLVALRPEHDRLTGRLARKGFSADDASAAVAASAVEALAAWGRTSGHEPDAARWIVSESWRGCRRVLRGEERANRRRADAADLEVLGERVVGTGCELSVADPVLARAQGTGVLGPAHAALVYETRVLGRPLVEVADSWGRTPGSLASLRRRAEQRLRAMLVAEELGP